MESWMKNIYYNTVKLKNNILIEISQVKLALNPYKDIMLSIPNNARPINNEADERFLKWQSNQGSYAVIKSHKKQPFFDKSNKKS